ncbi:hypothetical protein [Sphingomonas profundi]|uniref:hypothetical protein n=1 Tax=Alterirhizorhabdus profundi TaxID=2681549 RepID=UPI0012E86E4F|nr:hypothetical protein [Sphingomonas profundi]
MRITPILLGTCALLAGCGSKAPEENVVVENGMVVANEAAPSNPQAPSPNVTTDGWVGRWIGVEGLVLQIGAGERPGTYRLHIALMDSEGDYTGVADGDSIRFTRNGVSETIRATSGEETGLKWLAEKKDCLTIKPGEGFCRD